MKQVKLAPLDTEERSAAFNTYGCDRGMCPKALKLRFELACLGFEVPVSFDAKQVKAFVGGHQLTIKLGIGGKFLSASLPGGLPYEIQQAMNKAMKLAGCY